MVDAQKAPSLQQIKLSCTSPIVDANEALDQAHAILVLLGHAFEVNCEAERLAGMAMAEGALPYGRETSFAELSGRLFFDALAGVSTLIAAYKHVREDDRARLSKDQ